MSIDDKDGDEFLLNYVNEIQEEMDYASDRLIEVHQSLKRDIAAFKTGRKEFTIDQLEDRYQAYLRKLEKFSSAAEQLAITKAKLGVVGKDWYKIDTDNNED